MPHQQVVEGSARPTRSAGAVWPSQVWSAPLGPVSAAPQWCWGSSCLSSGVIALARGRVGWARLGSRAAGGVALGASMILMTVGALAPPPTTTVTPAAPASSTTSVAGLVARATPRPGPVATATTHGSSSPPTVAAPPVVQPAPAPARVAPGNGATALCNDGTLSFKARNRGACASHDGVKVFYK